MSYKYWQDLPADHESTLLRISGLLYHDRYSEVVSELSIHWKALYSYPCIVPFLHHLRGYSLLQLGELSSALLDLHETVLHDPNEKKYRENLGCAKSYAVNALEEAFSLRKWKVMVELATAFLKVDPEYTKARWLLGVGIDECGDPQKASEILGQLVADQPNDEVFRRSYALCLHHCKRTREAIQACRDGIRHLRGVGRAYGIVAEVLDWLFSLVKEQEEESQKDQESAECPIH